jgi:hypothetical protein
MSETGPATQKEAKKPAKFDLSDGISSEDFIALGSGLLKGIVFVLKIIFFPLVWVKRMISKLNGFLFSPHAERLLTDDEKNLLSSVPVFLGFVGLTLGAIFGIFAYFNNQEDFLSKLQNITDFAKLLGGFIKGVFDFIGLIWGFFYEYLLIGSRDFIVNDIFKNSDSVIPFLALSLIGFFGAIIILVILELKFVQTLLTKVSDVINYLVSLPFKFYERLQTLWMKILKKIGDPVMGGPEMLNKYTNKFYQKALKLVILFAVITLFSGLYIFFTNSNLSDFGQADDYLFLVVVMISAGLFSGFPVAFLIVKFLNSLSKDKYELRKVIPATNVASAQVTSSTSSTSKNDSPKAPKEVPVSKLKGKSAKERALERRKLREKGNK